VLPLKANLAVQEVRLQVANSDLESAQATLDAKQAELDVVQAQFDAAMAEKQVHAVHFLDMSHGVGLGRVVRKVCQHPDDHEFESQRWQ
jgi:hypothetical protein